MDRELAEELRRRAIYAATIRGFGEHAEDFAQEVLLRFCEGRSKHQTVDQGIVDSIRKRFGRPGLPGHARKLALESAISIFDEDGRIAIEPAPRRASDDGGDFDGFIGLLEDSRDRWLLNAFYFEGRLLKEIAQVLEVTESRASQLVAAAERRLRHQVLIRGDEVGIQLEKRACACGCGREFKCLPDSKQKYASTFCEGEHTGTMPTQTPLPRRRKPLLLKGEEMSEAKAVSYEAPVAPETELEDEQSETNDELSETETPESETEAPEAETEPSDPELEARGKGRFTMPFGEACDRFGISKFKLRRLINNKVIDCHKPNLRTLFVDPSDIGRLLEGDMPPKESKPRPAARNSVKPNQVRKAKATSSRATGKRRAPGRRGRPARAPETNFLRKIVIAAVIGAGSGLALCVGVGAYRFFH